MESPLSRRRFSTFAQERIQELADAEILVVIDRIERMTTTGFFLGKDGVVTDTRQGDAVATLYLRNQHRFVAFPFTTFAYFDRVSKSNWICELPLGIGHVTEEIVFMDTMWSSVLPTEKFALRVVLDPAVIESLNTAEVITPDGQNFGQGHPDPERADYLLEDYQNYSADAQLSEHEQHAD